MGCGSSQHPGMTGKYTDCPWRLPRSSLGQVVREAVREGGVISMVYLQVHRKH